MVTASPTSTATKTLICGFCGHVEACGCTLTSAGDQPWHWPSPSLCLLGSLVLCARLVGPRLPSGADSNYRPCRGAWLSHAFQRSTVRFKLRFPCLSIQSAGIGVLSSPTSRWSPGLYLPAWSQLTVLIRRWQGSSHLACREDRPAWATLAPPGWCGERSAAVLTLF